MQIVKVEGLFCRTQDCGLWDTSMNEKNKISGRDECPTYTFKEMTKYEKGKGCNLGDVEIDGSFWVLCNCGT